MLRCKCTHMYTHTQIWTWSTWRIGRVSWHGTNLSQSSKNIHHHLRRGGQLHHHQLRSTTHCCFTQYLCYLRYQRCEFDTHGYTITTNAPRIFGCFPGGGWCRGFPHYVSSEDSKIRFGLQLVPIQGPMRPCGWSHHHEDSPWGVDECTTGNNICTSVLVISHQIRCKQFECNCCMNHPPSIRSTKWSLV